MLLVSTRLYIHGFLQGVSIALLCKSCTSYDRDVRLSVCLSVCLTYADTVWKPRKLGSRNLASPTDSPRTLVFGTKNSSRNSKGFTPSEVQKNLWVAGAPPPDPLVGWGAPFPTSRRLRRLDSRRLRRLDLLRSRPRPHKSSYDVGKRYERSPGRNRTFEILS